MRLTAATVRSLKCPPGKSEQTFFDEALPGFGLRVRASGAMTWLAQYAVAGRTRKVFLGSPDVVDPGKAREAAKALLASVHLGGDPAREKAAERVRAAETFGGLLPTYLDHKRAQMKPRSFEETERHLISHARTLHSEPLKVIDRRMIAALLARIAKNSGPVAANRVRASLSAYFVWAAKEGIIDANPVAFTNKQNENDSRSRVLADHELALIWRAMAENHYGQIARLLMLTGARRDEIGGLRWSEVDLDDALITLPPERTKNRREHLVPLSAAALAILKAQPHRVESDGSDRDHVFGHAAGRGFSDWSSSKGELDARITEANSGKPLQPWVLHDFRRSISTTLHERFAVSPHVVEVILAHAGGHRSGVAGTYNRALYLEERRRALARWGEHIIGLASGKPSKAKVVPLRSKRA